jgi:histidine triad (HIT) family protein
VLCKFEKVRSIDYTLSMSKSIFSRIIDGEIPAYTVYENAFVYAFLDIRPVAPGHVLVVPRTQIDAFDAVAEPFYTEMFRAAALIAGAQKLAFWVERVSLQVYGFEVPHAHIHLIPGNTMPEVAFVPKAAVSAEDLKWAQTKIVAALSSLN